MPAKVQPAQNVTSEIDRMIAEFEEAAADMRKCHRRIDVVLEQAQDFRKEPHKDQPIILNLQEITLIEAGLELLIDQAYEQINAIDDDISLDRSTKDDYIAGVQEALENQKAVLEKMTSHKQRLEEANAQE
jgi:translation elongation factor EF-G